MQDRTWIRIIGELAVLFSLFLLLGCEQKPQQALGTLEWDRCNCIAPASEVNTEILPLTHFLRVIRGIVLRGESLHGLSTDLLFLLISTARFSKRLE